MGKNRANYLYAITYIWEFYSKSCAIVTHLEPRPLLIGREGNKRPPAPKELKKEYLYCTFHLKTLEFE